MPLPLRFLSKAARPALAAVFTAIALAPQAALAQKYPERPIRLVVPFPTGGGTDILARNLAHRLGEVLGQQLVVENRGGAGGSIGSEVVAKAAPDGYTILFVPNSLTINAALYKNLPFDAEKSFAPIGLVATAPQVLVVNPALPIQSVRDLITQASARPGGLNWSSAGNGSPGHLATALFNRMSGANITHVQYKGGGPAINDLLAGHTQAGIQTLAVVRPFVASGKLRAIGVATPRRSQLLPQVPTIAEAGVPGYEAELWYGLFAPAGTPAVVVQSLNAALNKVLADHDVQKQLAEQGFEPRPGSPEDFRSLVVKDLARTAKVVAEANIKAE